MHAIRATAPYDRAIHATAELLAKMRVDAIFVGHVARAAWLGVGLEDGAIDVLALMNAPQKGQLAMMASNRGFRVEREELEEADELDLVPLHFEELRVHVLLATNALYGRMVSSGVEAAIGDRVIRVPRAEDLALMLLMAEDDGSVQSLAGLPEFDRGAFQERLASIGLGGLVDR
jgi:hypothetical protein